MPDPGSLWPDLRPFLEEDRVEDDVTTALLVPGSSEGGGTVRVKEDGVLSGLDVARAVLHTVDPRVVFETTASDGDRVRAGSVVAQASGSFRSILAAERVALNFLQRMSGVATLTRRFVERVEGTAVTILATRKTAPGLRTFDLAAVRDGGGDVHRADLAERILVKDNHVAAAGGMAKVVARLTEGGGPGVPVGIEVTDLDELDGVLVPGVDVVLLDNVGPTLCRRAVERLRAAFPEGGGPALEASGGITLETVRAFAETGVDRISVGALTHSSRALDVSMDVVWAFP